MNDEHDKPAVTQTSDAVPFFVLTIALTALGDWLFYSHPLGWTVGIYGAVLLIVVSSLGSAHSSTRVGLLLAIVTATLCLRCVYEPNTVSVLLLLLGLVTLALQRREGWIPDITTWLWRWLHFFVRGLTQGGIGLGLVLGSCVAAPFSGRTASWPGRAKSWPGLRGCQRWCVSRCQPRWA